MLGLAMAPFENLLSDYAVLGLAGPPWIAIDLNRGFLKFAEVVDSCWFNLAEFNALFCFRFDTPRPIIEVCFV